MKKINKKNKSNFFTSEEDIVFSDGEVISGNYRTQGSIKAEGILYLEGGTVLEAEGNIEINDVMPTSINEPPQFLAFSENLIGSLTAGNLGSDKYPLGYTYLVAGTVTITSLVAASSVDIECNFYTETQYLYGTAGVGTIKCAGGVSVEAFKRIYGDSITASLNNCISLESCDIDIKPENLTAGTVEENGVIIYPPQSTKSSTEENLKEKELEKLLKTLVIIFLCSAAFRR